MPMNQLGALMTGSWGPGASGLRRRRDTISLLGEVAVATAAATRQWVRFGNFEADIEGGELYRDGHRVAVQRQPFAVLQLLLAHPGEVVSREELRRQLWPGDTFVDFDAGLNAAIKRLRQALDDAADNPRFIATLPRRGYRFIAPVWLPPGLGVAPTLQMPRRQRRGRWVAGLAAGVALAGTAFLLRPVLPMPQLAEATALTPASHIPTDQELVTDGPNVYFTQWVGDAGRELERVSAVGGLPQPVAMPFAPSVSVHVFDLSPDGTELLANAGTQNQVSLWEIPIQGGAARRLGAMALDATWFRNGRDLVVARGNALYREDADGKQVRLLAPTPGQAFSPRWSPDGTRLRFSAYQNGLLHSQFWELDARRARLRQVGPTQPTVPSQSDGVWSPDGRYFVYSPNIYPGVIWARSERTSLWRRAPRAPVALTVGPVSFFHPLFSKDGQHLFAVGKLSRGELQRYDGRVWKPFLGGRSADNVEYSRDGRWLVYVSYPDDEIWRMDLRDGNAVQLTHDDGSCIFPEWSPDGREIAYTLDVNGEPWRTMLVSSDGSRTEQVSPPGMEAGQEAWSPEGKRLAVVYKVANSAAVAQLGVLELGSQHIHPIPDSVGYGWPNWSADGRYLLARKPQPNGLAVFDFVTERWLPIASPYPNFARWSRDGGAIDFNTLGGPQPGLYRIQVMKGHGLHFGPAKMVLSLQGVVAAGSYGEWTGFAADGSPLVMRNTGYDAIYRFDWHAPH